MAELIRHLSGSQILRYPLGSHTQRIGRTDENDICIPDPSISGHHADIVVKPSPYLSGAEDYFIVDRGSRNGVVINGDRKTRHRLKHGDRISIGKLKLEFVDDRQDSGDRTIINRPDE